MGKVKYIKSCRKEQKCQKCKRVIMVGSPYFKGELYHARPIVRCTECGLKHYEVTTSDYVRTIGRLAEDWQEDYGVNDGTVDAIVETLRDVQDTCQDNLDNIPEQLQEGSAGALLQERIDELEGAIYELESDGEWNGFLEKAYDELHEEDQEVIDAEREKRNGADYEEWYDEFVKAGGDTAVNWTDLVEEEVAMFIEDALSGLSY